ncbi:hypothetical protein FALCPG4_014992 [Fusarium falciforme]
MEYDVDPNDPDESDDAQLRFIHIAFDRMVNHAKAVITPDTVSWNALFEVNHKELIKERSKPFHFRFKAETQRRYTLMVKQLLAYIVRCAYDVMMEHADDLIDVWKDHGGDPEAPEVSRLLDLLENDVLELYISVLDHFTKDTEYDSVLVSFLTVLSVCADGTWEGYANFTPKLSVIMAVSRLCVVKYAVDQRAKAIMQKMQQGQNREEAEENSPSNFVLISEMTRWFMVGGGEGWETTPTQFIIRLRNFGMAAHNNTAAQGSVSWDKEHIVFKGIRLSILDVQAMMRMAVHQLEDILYKDLLFLAQLSGGFLPRAYELLTIRHRNTANGGIRNILVDQGLIMIVTGVHKGFSTSGRLKIIHRFLSREVGTPLTYFLWLSWHHRSRFFGVEVI